MYPTISEYLEAIKSAEDNFEQLKHLRPVLEDDGSPIMTSGNFAVVFKMKDEQTGKLYAVKCFLREQEGRAEAYRMIAEELEYVSSTFLTPIKYLDKELFVDTNAGDEQEFPVLLMDWVEGETLDKYIRKHLDDQYELSLIAYQFSRLAMWLMPQPFAHGDLKPDNILVKSNGTLVLVDYDGMYVPAMKGQKARELGSPDFRHPSRTETDFDEHIDDFSLASILLSLKAISLQPSLLEEYGAQDRLLFSEKDYRNLSESKVMDALKPHMQDAELASLYSLFILAASQNNLSGVSFRLFYLNRPKEPELTDADLDAWEAAIEENMPHGNVRRWTLLEFAKNYGKMQVGEFVNKETGELFKSCIFTKTDGTRTFVAFSAKIGELTPKEIAAMKDVLVVVQNKDGYYSLCKRNAYDDAKGIKTKLCSNGNIINRELRVKSSNAKFGILDIEEQYAEGSSWRTKLCYYNIFEDGRYNLSDIESIKYDKEKDIVQIDFNQLVDDRYDSIWFSRQFEKIHMEFYRHHILTMEFNSRYDKASFLLEDLFYAFCSLSLLENGNAIVTLNGEAFHVKHIQNYYTEAQMRNMDQLENIRFISDVIDDEILSTEVTDEDLDNAWTDEFGVRYSADRKRLLGVYSSYLPDYEIPEGTTVICDDSLNGFWHEIDGLMIGGKITIPSTVQNIGRNPFRGDYDTIICKSPYFVVEDDALYSVDKKRLIACFHKGFDFVVPDSVEEIGSFAFYACSINCIKIPKSVSNIGDNPFIDTEINNVIIDSDSYYYVKDGALYRRNPKELVAYWGKPNLMFVDEKTTEIGPFAFWNGIERIGLPDSIRKVSESAFYGYGANPKQIFIPENSPIKFENLIIYKNKSRGEILKYIHDEYGVIYSKDGKILLKAPNNIVECNIKEDTIVIDDNAFSFCKDLRSIIISSSIKRIGERAFWCCRSLEQMTIPDSVIEIGIEAFAGCESLKQIVIPNSITSISNRTFSSCSSLLSISIPISVTNIGEFAFEDCNSLINISIPESVSSIGKSAFQDCWSLAQISIPQSITKINECTFLRCISLKQVIIPDSVQIIENGAFMECTRLQSLSLPPGIKSINDTTFASCYNLDEIVIPRGVVNIGANAFLQCGRLKKIWFSENLAHIDPSTFIGCTKLEFIFIPDNTFDRFEKLLPNFREILMEEVIIDNHEGLRRVFSKKEIESVNKAEVVRSALTNSVCFYMNDGCQKYIPLSKDSKLSIGNSIKLEMAKLIEFTDEGIYYGFDGYDEYYSKFLVEA